MGRLGGRITGLLDFLNWIHVSEISDVVPAITGLIAHIEAFEWTEEWRNGLRGHIEVVLIQVSEVTVTEIDDKVVAKIVAMLPVFMQVLEGVLRLVEEFQDMVLERRREAEGEEG